MSLLLTLLLQKADALVEKAFPNDGPGGVVLVLRKGETLFHKARGLSDLAAARPLEPGSVFDLASLSKPFTSLAILILEERGKLSLDDDIRKHLQELPVRAKAVRILDLLHMVSGHADYLPLFDDLAKGTNEEVARRVGAAGLVFPTGTKHAYSNTDYALLGLIVARASGKSYGDFLSEAVFKPLGMKSTVVLQAGVDVPRRATGYAREAGAWKVDRLDTPGIVGDGGVFSSAEDLALWDRGLSTLVKPATLRRAFTSGPAGPYGLGWVVSGDTVWHNGRWAGSRSILTRNLKTGLTVIVLSNQASADVEGLARKLSGHFDAP